MQDNLDKYIKTEIVEAESGFNNDQGWQHLVAKQKVIFLKRTAVIGICAATFIGILIFSWQTRLEPVSTISEYEKRKKLEEYEQKLSGTYEEIIICADCNGQVFKIEIKQVPENQSIIRF